MDTATKRRAAERIRRAVTKTLKMRGFVRGKSAFWARPREHVVEFVHLHLFTFAPSFRAHCGIRVLNDDFAAVALNGPDSDRCVSDGRRTYSLDFTDDPERIAQCAAEIARFCAEVAEPWFERFAGARILLPSESPLNERARLNLERSFKGLADPDTVQLSKELLGVA
jgi:hypothetical protein